MDQIVSKKRVPYRKIEDYAILHRNSNPIYLNKTANKIWELIDGESNIRTIAHQLVADLHYDSVLFDRVASSVARVAQTLCQSGVAEVRGDEPLPAAMSEFTGETKTLEEGVHAAQEECMTARSSGKATTLAEQMEKLYWDHFYIRKMHVELTYRCNFRCIHCYNTTHIGGKAELTTSEWVRTLADMAAMGCYLIVFTGGELFVRKDVLEILDAACSYGFSFRLNTNGSLVDEKILARLEAMRPFLQSLDISFYGADSDTHDALARRPGSYQHTLRAVRLLLEADMPMVAKFITMRDNFDGIDTFEKDMRALGVPYVVNTGALIPRTDRSHDPLVQILTDEQYTAMMRSRPDSKGDGGQGSCRPGHVRGAITPEGFVSPCEWLTDFKLGNLREQSLSEIWYGESFREFRSIFDHESECSGCHLHSNCGRCPAHSYLETGNLLKCAPIQRHNAEICLDLTRVN